MKSIGSQIKEARQKRHLSQSALARKVGCKQSALSMFEGGRMTALNAQVIGKLCAELGLLPPQAGELESTGEVAVGGRVRVFCPNGECPGNLPVRMGGRVVMVPRAHLAEEGEHHCRWCGEVLERACPECGAPVNEGAFCVHCGTAYVAVERVDNMTERLQLSERIMAWHE